MEDDDHDAGPEGRTRQPKQLNWDLPFDLSEIDLSDETPLSLEDLEGMIDNPSPRARLRRFVRAPVRTLQKLGRATRPRWQRATRGWADQDWWSLDSHLCLHLGTLLMEQGRHAKSFPDDLTYDEWTAQLQAAGAALLDFDPDDAQRVGAAQSALRWTADNLARLWD
jgi:hypothetical protein